MNTKEEALKSQVLWGYRSISDHLPNDFWGRERSQFGRDFIRFLSCLHHHHQSVSGFQVDKWSVWKWGEKCALKKLMSNFGNRCDVLEPVIKNALVTET